MDLFQPKKPEEYGFKEIIYEKRDWIARVTINRPKFYNAYNTPCLKEMITAFKDASWDDGVGVIIFTGAGDKAFCTGGDVKEYATYYTQRPRDYFKYMGIFAGYIESIVKCGKPVICRLNGMAVGGGNESHMACDLSIMADDTYIGQIGTNVGSVACGGATQWLPLFVGDRRAVSAHLRVSLRHRGGGQHHLLNPIEACRTVVVDEENDCSLCFTNPPITSGSRAGIVLSEVSDSLVATHDVSKIIRRPVVNHHDLEIGVILCEQ